MEKIAKRSKKLTIIKLGGSLLTDKKIPNTLRTKIVKQIAQEIKECIDLDYIEDLILIHGVGSFGHPPILKHKLQYGFTSKDQLIHLSKTQKLVNDYRNRIAGEFISIGLPINLMHPSSLAISNKMQIKSFFSEAIIGYFNLGMIPFMGGDMLFDQKMGFSVGSGDQLAVFLAKKFNAHNLIFATDVEGIFNSDPKLNEKPDLISEFSLKQTKIFLNNAMQTQTSDASGMMLGKIKALLPLSERVQEGLNISIISMNPQHNLKKLLSGISFPFTKIVS